MQFRLFDLDEKDENSYHRDRHIIDEVVGSFRGKVYNSNFSE